MAKTGKRLAVLSAQLEEIYQQDFIKGFERFAFDKGFDVCIFAMYQKFQESKPQRSERARSMILLLRSF